MAKAITPVADRFWPKVKRGPGCWVWLASVDKDGYGQIGSSRRPATMLKAHRVMWELKRGAVPRGLCVLHKCDNPRCVRLAHLFLGTGLDNARDMTAKGRNIFQKRNPSSKLTAAQVRAIRRQRADGLLLSTIAQTFGVTQGTVSRVVTRVRRGNVR